MFNEEIKRHLPHGWIVQVADKLAVSRGTIYRAMRDPENPVYLNIIREIVAFAHKHKSEKEAIQEEIKKLSA